MKIVPSVCHHRRSAWRAALGRAFRSSRGHEADESDSKCIHQPPYVGCCGIQSVAAATAAFALWVLGCTIPALRGQDYSSDKLAAVPEISVPLTAEEAAALAAVEVRIAGVEALAAKIDDPAYKASVAASMDDLRKRRAALARKFDPGLYEALMHAVISRYQVVALWLTPARESPRTKKPLDGQMQTGSQPKSGTAAEKVTTTTAN